MTDDTTVMMFKTKRSTPRWRENQRVWVQRAHGNHLDVVFRWRGSGRYVKGVVAKDDTAVGKLKEFEVEPRFAYFVANFQGGR